MEQIEEILDETRRRSRPTVVGVRSGGATRLWSHGELPDGESSVFEIGSVTKVVTSLLLADLVRTGEVGYDDPVAAHLPAAPPVVGRPVTLVDLATHHSGLWHNGGTGGYRSFAAVLPETGDAASCSRPGPAASTGSASAW